MQDKCLVLCYCGPPLSFVVETTIERIASADCINRYRISNAYQWRLGSQDGSAAATLWEQSTGTDPMTTATIASIASQTAMAAIAALNTRPSTISGAHAQGAAIKGGCKSIAKLATIAAAGDSLQLRLHLDSLQTAVLDAADDTHWDYDTIAMWLYS